MVNALLDAKKETFTVWDVNVHANYVEGYSSGGRVKLPTLEDSSSGLQVYRKSLCCYINMGADSVISNGRYTYQLIFV